MGSNVSHQLPTFLFTSDSKAGIDTLCCQLSDRRGCALIQQTQAVTHTAVGQSGKHTGRAVIQINVLLIRNILKTRGDILLADPSESEPLAP